MFGSVGLYLNFSVFQAHPKHFNNSELRREGEEGDEGEEAGVVTFAAFPQVHSSNWMLEHTFGEEQPKQPKGRKKCDG